jgi:F420-dependent oxidoreductase-like protein
VRAVVRLGVMIEGQEDLTWEQWRHLARRVEELGFDSLWRSDHFHSLVGVPDREALETWTSLSVIAAETSRIAFGPLVCSVTFRHPSLLARMAAAVDRVSGGRLACGIGAGWNEGEHAAFGIPFPPVGTRMHMLEEQAQILRLLWSGEPVSFEGRQYRLDNARCLPTPAQKRLPIVIGGGGARTLRIAARHADEWNFIGGGVEQFATKLSALRDACKEAKRDPDEITPSWMGAFLVGSDQKDLEEHARSVQRALPPLQQMEPGAMIQMLRDSGGWLVGTTDEVAEQIRARGKAGLQRMMLQHYDHANDRPLEVISRDVLPAVA